MAFYQSGNSQYLFNMRYNKYCETNSVTVSGLSFLELSKRKQSFLVLMKGVVQNKLTSKFFYFLQWLLADKL